jgi:glutaredoxin
MDDATPTGVDGASPTAVVLYTRPGCGLCTETRDFLTALLARRAADGRRSALLVERDIETDPAWERAYFAEIPVVELGDRRLTLATSPARIERFVAEVLDR